MNYFVFNRKHFVTAVILAFNIFVNAIRINMDVQLRRADNLSSLFKNIRDSAIMFIL